MPYRILLTNARRTLRRKPQVQGHSTGPGHVGQTDRVEIRSDRGLVLFYRPRRSGLRS